MMARTTNEWIGRTDDEAIPPRVKVRIFQAFDGRCSHCTLLIVGKLRPAYDHTIALINGGENRESNVSLLCMPCHALKTKADVAEKAKVARVRKRHIGLKKPRSIRSWRRFDGSIVHAPRER